MDGEDCIRFLGDVQRLSFGPEDVLVLSFEQELPDSTTDYFRGYMSECFPGRKCVVLSGGCKLGVLSPKAGE